MSYSHLGTLRARDTTAMIAEAFDSAQGYMCRVDTTCIIQGWEPEFDSPPCVDIDLYYRFISVDVTRSASLAE